MKALILAAGLGSRLKEATKETPKAMVKINFKPLISFQIEALKDNNITDIGVVLGYKSNILKSYLLENHKDINFSFFINDEYEFTNSAFSFYCAKEFVNEDSYIHLNCDILFSKELLSIIIKSKHSNVIAISKNIQLTDNMEQVELDNKNKIIKMDNMKFKEASFKAYGLAKLSSKSTKYINDKIQELLKQNNKNENYYGIIRQAVLDINYYGIDSNNLFLFEVNTLSDLKKANQKLEK